MTVRHKRILLWAFVLAVAALAGTVPIRNWQQQRARKQLAQQCRLLRDAGRWDELEQIARGWTQWDADSAEAWLYRAQVAEARQDWSAEVDLLSRIPEHDPRSIPALVEQAKLEFGPLYRPLAGETTCRKILQREPRVSFAHQRLIQYYAITLQREKLVAQIRDAIAHEREPREAYIYLFLINTLRLGDGVEMNERWLEANPGSEIFAVARAMQIPEPTDDNVRGPAEQLEMIRQVSAKKADLVDSLLQKYPHNLELLAYRIEQAITVGDEDLVITLLAQADPGAERDSRFWRYKGWLHETADELTEAETCYQQVARIDPLDWNAWNRLAVLYRRLQKTDELERLSRRVEEAQSLRKVIRGAGSADQVPTKALEMLAKYAYDCGADWLGEALDHRVQQLQGEG